ncbi:MAG: DUF302 domain-containing protein [Tabrizicola sp.]|nr:DUF302 domain-containing protein [Tabrizicola sp.]
MKQIVLSAALACAALPALAEVVQLKSAKAVGPTVDALEAAVTEAGAKVVARVDHGKGAASVDMPLGESQLLIFGNPALGTPVMQADPLAGLRLPLKVLVYADAEGQVWLAYENPADMFAGLAIPAEGGAIEKMAGALAKLTEKAAQ